MSKDLPCGRKFIPILLFLVIGLLLIINYVYPLVHQAFNISYNYPLLQYSFVIASYLCIVLLVLTENNNLEEFHIDHLSLAILIIFGLIRGNFRNPGEIYFKICIYLLCSILIFAFIVYFRKIPKTKPMWVLVSFLSCLLIIPFAIIYSLHPVINPTSTILANGFLWNAVRNAYFDLSFVSPFEEIIFRGILWGLLRRWGWTDKRIFWFQVILFWLVHFWEAFVNPLAFFTILPITIIILSLLVYYAKRISPSIIFHTAVNSLVAIIVQFYIK